MAELTFAKSSSTSCQGLEVVPVDEPSNDQEDPDPPSPQPSTSSFNVVRLFTDSVSRSDCYNQQVLPENVEVSRPEPPLRVSRVRERYERADCGSIVIPVGGTLSRPLKKPPKIDSSTDADFKGTLRERTCLMFLSEWLADVHFIVGTDAERERLPAHSFILSIASNPFYAMFHGGFERHAEIEIPDVEPAAFKVLLKYLYTDEVDLKADSALATLYAAKKYLISFLARAAIIFLEANLNAENVCVLLAQSTLFEEEELITRCWQVVDANAERVLRSEGFADIDYGLFEQIISRETLIVRERTVYEAAVRWAKAECARRGEPPTATGVRSALAEALHFIRFPAMTISEFANGPAKSDLLTCQEINNIFLHFAAEEKPRLPFPIKARAGLPMRVCTRFQASLHGTNQWRYRGRCDSIQFLVDRRIFVTGYGLYGSSNGACEYKVRMELKKGKEVLDSVSTSFCSNGQPDPFPVFFDHPVQIDAEIKYTASVVIEGKELSHFGQEGMPEISVIVSSASTADGGERDECVNFFFTPSADSKNGTGVQGGQIPEIIFYV